MVKKIKNLVKKLTAIEWVILGISVSALVIGLFSVIWPWRLWFTYF